MTGFAVGFYRRYIKTNKLQAELYEIAKVLGFGITGSVVFYVGYLFIPQLAEVMIELLMLDTSNSAFMSFSGWIFIGAMYLYSFFAYVALVIALIYYKTVARAITEAIISINKWYVSTKNYKS